MKRGKIAISIVLILVLSISAQAITFTDIFNNLKDFFSGTPTGAQVIMPEAVDMGTWVPVISLPIAGSTASTTDVITYSQATYSAITFTGTRTSVNGVPITVTFASSTGDSMGSLIIPAGGPGLISSAITLTATPFTPVAGAGNGVITRVTAVGGVLTFAAGATLTLTPIIPTPTPTPSAGGGGGGAKTKTWTYVESWEPEVTQPCKPGSQVEIMLTNVNWNNADGLWYARQDNVQTIVYENNNVKEKYTYKIEQTTDTPIKVPNSETWAGTGNTYQIILQTGYSGIKPIAPRIEYQVNIDCPGTAVPIATAPPITTEPPQPQYPTAPPITPEYIVPVNPYHDEMKKWWDNGGTDPVPEDWGQYMEEFMNSEIVIPEEYVGGCVTWTVAGNCDYRAAWEQKLKDNPLAQFMIKLDEINAALTGKIPARFIAVDILYQKCIPGTTESWVAKIHPCTQADYGKSSTEIEPPTAEEIVPPTEEIVPPKKEYPTEEITPPTEEIIPPTEETTPPTTEEIAPPTPKDTIPTPIIPTPVEPPEEVPGPPIIPVKTPILGSCPGCPTICPPPARIPPEPQPQKPNLPITDGQGGGGKGKGQPSMPFEPINGYPDAEQCDNQGVNLGYGCIPNCNEPQTFHNHVLLTEIFASKTLSNYVELYNPTPAPLDVSDYKLTNAQTDDYYSGEFVLQLPEGTEIQPGEYLTISLSDDKTFSETFGTQPDIELSEDEDDIPNLQIIKLETITPVQEARVSTTDSRVAITGSLVTEFEIQEGENTKILDKEGKVVFTSETYGIIVTKENGKHYITDKQTGKQIPVTFERSPGKRSIKNEKGQTLYEYETPVTTQPTKHGTIVKDATTQQIIEIIYLIDPNRPNENWNYQYGDILSYELSTINGKQINTVKELTDSSINIRDAQTGEILQTTPLNEEKTIEQKGGIALSQDKLTLVLFTERAGIKDVDILRVTGGHPVFKNEKDTKPEQQHAMYKEEDWTPQKINGLQDKTLNDIKDLTNSQITLLPEKISATNIITSVINAYDPSSQALGKVYRSWNRLDYNEGGERKPQGQEQTINLEAFKKGKPTFAECSEYLTYNDFPDEELLQQTYEELKKQNSEIDKLNKYQICQNMLSLILQCELESNFKTPETFEATNTQETITLTNNELDTSATSSVALTPTSFCDTLSGEVKGMFRQAPKNKFTLEYANGATLIVEQEDSSKIYYTETQEEKLQQTQETTTQEGAYGIVKTRADKPLNTSVAENMDYNAYAMYIRTPVARRSYDSIETVPNKQNLPPGTPSQQYIGGSTSPTQAPERDGETTAYSYDNIPKATGIFEITGSQAVQIPISAQNYNGITGHDETSEHWEYTWVLSLATPGRAPDQLYIPPEIQDCETEINQYRENPIPQGQGEDALITPLTLNCEQQTVTVNVPQNSQNVNAYQCTDNRCYSIPIRTEAEYTCGDESQIEIIGYDYEQVQQPPQQFQPIQQTLTPEQNTIQTGQNKVQFTQIQQPIEVKLGPVQSAPLPPNPYLTTVGGPLQIEVSTATKTQATVTMEYDLPNGYDLESIAGFVWLTNHWEYIGGTINPTEKTITYTITDIQKYNTNGKIITTAMANWCTNCKERFDKIYDNGQNAIILLHDITSAPQTWKYLVNDLITLNHKAQIWTFGYSMNKTLEQSAQILANIIQQQNFPTIEIIAHGTGGTIAHKAIEYSLINELDAHNKVSKIILAGTTNEPIQTEELYKNIFTDATNKKTLTTMTNLNAPAVQDTLTFQTIELIPTIKYYTIAGTETIPENQEYFTYLANEAEYEQENDGLITSRSTELKNTEYCKNYYELELNHNELITDEKARQLIVSLLDGTIGTPDPSNIKTITVDIQNCKPGDKLVIKGDKPITKEYPLAGCGCGNEICEPDETAMNCPQDCFITAENQICQTIQIPLTILTFVALAITAYLTYASKRKHFNKPTKISLYTAITILVLLTTAVTMICTFNIMPILALIATIAILLYRVKHK